jgi:hypothetical protein
VSASRFCALSGLAVCFAFPPSSAAEPCVAQASVEPESAVVGQQVLYRLSILTLESVSSVEWVEPPTFSGFRSERLPGRPQGGDTVSDGVSYHVREEHRALFAEAPGSRTIAPSGLRCHVASGDRAFATPVPPVTLSVRPLPAEGRPESFSGLVGPLVVRTVVEPRRVHLGESVRLAVMITGAGNLWDTPDPLAGHAFDSAEVFARRPSLVLDPGTVLAVRQHFAYDIVPRVAGSLRLPPIRLEYFDPESGRYRTAETPETTVEVLPRRNPSEGNPRGS